MRTKLTKASSVQATVLLTGWTARTQDLTYRRYVEDLILRLAPAHIYIRPMWLSFVEMVELQPMLQDTGQSSKVRAALQQILNKGGGS